MRFVRRILGPDTPRERQCAFGCGKTATAQVQINDFSLQTCRDDVDRALDMYLESREK